MHAVVHVEAVGDEHRRPVPGREVVAGGVELGERRVPRVGLGLVRVEARDLRPPDVVPRSDRVDDMLDRVAGTRQVGATEPRVDRPDVDDHVGRVPPLGAPLGEPTRHRDVGRHAEVPGRRVPRRQAAGGARHDRAEAEVGEVLGQRAMPTRRVHACRQHRVAHDRHRAERSGRERDRRRRDRCRRYDSNRRRDRHPGDETGERPEGLDRAQPTSRLWMSVVRAWTARVSSVLTFSSCSCSTKSWSALACWNAA